MQGANCAIQVLIPTAMPSSQPRQSSCLPAGLWDPRDGAPSGIKLASSCFRNLRHQIWFTLTGKREDRVLHALPPSCTLPLKETGCFWERKLRLSKPPTQPESNVRVLCLTSTQLKIKSFLSCTPCIIYFFCIQTETKKAAFTRETQRPQKSTTNNCTTVVLELHKHIFCVFHRRTALINIF